MKISKTTKKCATKVVTKKCAVRTAKTPKAPATKPVTFTIRAEKGKAVYLAGEFNDWSVSAKKLAWKAKEGYYATTIKLAPGEYQYKFVIDGVWCADPENVNSVRNDQGTFNSVATVK
ncbi:MAG: glycogen-binding domain-containing protein [Kiritimatiellae bacterium]|nr:glycogen-binding domain-containing protein [Kiritimatiellia bacterium]